MSEFDGTVAFTTRPGVPYYVVEMKPGDPIGYVIHTMFGSKAEEALWNNIRRLEAALATTHNDAVEKAAKVCDKYPVNSHGALPTDPAEAARQTANELSAAILSLKQEVRGKIETLPEPIEVWACLHYDVYLGASKYSRESALEYASDGEVYRATLTFKEKLK